MGARHEGCVTAAIARLKSEGVLEGEHGGHVIWLSLDLSTPISTERGAEEFLRLETRA